jgi:fermentation-respiration switch protein FrsA (DUF1100 family)
MIDISRIDYSKLDRPEVVMFLFHPRSDWQGEQAPEGTMDLLIPVEGAVVVGARFHPAEKSAPGILFFHGNGEIVADYDDMGPLYTRMGINFLAVDYRGYGRSTGQPTCTAMIRDAHVIFHFVRGWLKENGYGGPLIVMGRSLGSASAIELACHYGEGLAGLIVESGFALTGPLLELLGVSLDSLGAGEGDGFRNIEKIRTIVTPTLIIHAEGDHIIPFSEGRSLYEASGAGNKWFLAVPDANHNDIFIRGLPEYMASIGGMVERIKGEEGRGHKR